MSDLKKETKDATAKDQNGTAGDKKEQATAANNKTELGLLEEDDEFEEFETEDWQQDGKDAATDGDKDVNLWEDNWDDDNIEDDFTVQLRAELEKRGQKLDL